MGMFGNNPGLRDKFSQAGDFLLANSGSQAGLEGMQQHAQILQQQAETQRQLALQAAKGATPEPTTMQRNYDWMKSISPDLAGTYLRSQANPMTLMTDPTTGAVGFYPKGGMQQQGPVTRSIGGKTYYQIGGDWYDNPEGR